MSKTVQDLVDLMERLAPTRFAESWDNVGLLVGDANKPLRKLMLAIDYTSTVARQARDLRCDGVLAYHPPIFKPMGKLVATGASELVFEAVRDGIAIYSPHTALDVAPYGTNDALADLIEMRNVVPLRPAKPSALNYKLVVYVPTPSTEKVATALFDAGAGHIGNYSHCSFSSPGQGTFLGEEGTNPTIGRPGQLERVDETRLETIVPPARLNAVLTALRSAHPYEEPAFDVFESFTPEAVRGMGRIGTVPEGATVEMLVNRLKRALDINGVLVAGEIDRPVRRAALCAGSCGDLLDTAIANRVDLYLTGEMRHHDALKAVRAGVTVVCLLHSNSERPVLKWLEKQFRSVLPEVDCVISSEDRDPFSVL